MPLLRAAALRAFKLGVIPYGIAARDRRPGITLLIYHRIGGNTSREADLPLDLFAWQMRWLHEHCAVVPLDQVVDIAQRGLIYDHDLVVITFDDGYEEVHRCAFPLLVRYNLPAVVYLSTAFVEAQEPFTFEQGRPVQYGRPLRWDQAEEMRGSGLVSFGAHTHTHSDLAALPGDRVQEEIDLANDLIARRLGLPPAHFAYPWGRVSPAARGAVAAAYRTAAVGGTCKNPYGAIDLQALRRVPIQRSDGRLFFRLKLGSYLVGEEWMRRLGDRWRRSAARALVSE